MGSDSERLVRLGEISGVYGVRGWVKLHSYTEPRSNLIEYSHWLLDNGRRRWSVEVEAARAAGKQLLAKISGVDDRDLARDLIGTAIHVARSSLPACEPDEYYWADLEGLKVVNTAGLELGRVERLFATGANDVIDLGGQRLIPFVADRTVVAIDIELGQIVVDWDPSYWE